MQTIRIIYKPQPEVSPTVTAVSSLLKNCLRFKVQVTFEELETVLRAKYFERYNNIPFDIGRISESIKQAVGVLDYGPENCNTGTTWHARVSIGNEGSLVIYIEIASGFLHAVNKSVSVLTADLKSVGHKFEADEVQVYAGKLGGLEARFWWD